MKRALLWILVVGVFHASYAQDYLLKARSSLLAHDTTTAIAAYQQALKAGQKPSEANYQLGALLLARHQYNEAMPYLQTAIKLDDENADAVKLLGDAYAQKKDMKSALRTYRSAEILAPKNGPLEVALGEALLSVDSIDAAIVVFTRAKEFDPSNPAIYDGLGESYLRQNVLVLAITNFQKAIELSPKDAAEHNKLAKVFFKNRQYTDAVKEYDDVLAIDSTNIEALFEKGRIYVLAKLFRQGVAPLLRYTELRPRGAEGLGFLARAYFGADDFADAVKAANRALQIDSSDVEVWRALAHAATELREYPEALNAFAALIRRNALKPEDQAKYGTALVGAGREDEALRHLLEAVKDDSSNCDPYFNLGYLYMKKQDYENAAAMFEKKIGCDPRSLSSYVNAAACYMQRKNFPRAGELLRKAVDLQPAFLQSRLWLARYYIYVDSLDLAMEQYDQVIKIIGPDVDKNRKDLAEAHGQRGSVLFGQKKYAKAIEEFRTALSLGYENGPMELSWGEALLQLLDPKGDSDENQKLKEESIRHLRKSVELDDKNFAAHLWLAQALVLARIEGDPGNGKLTAEACGEYRKVLRLDPRNDDAKKGMVRIDCH